jgi:hypothetical protein
LKSSPKQPDDLAVVERTKSAGRRLGEQVERAAGQRRAGLDRSCKVIDQGEYPR